MYLRTVYRDGSTVNTQLIAPKTRVAPIKKQLIPRLELLGATILARLLSSVQAFLKSAITISQSYYWVDSFTTLCWIKNERHWKQYVQHRVEIRCISDRNFWRHCPGTSNPADLPSQSVNSGDLVNNQLWWHGPAFLKDELSSWPDLPTTFDTEDTNKELVKTPLSLFIHWHLKPGVIQVKL